MAQAKVKCPICGDTKEVTLTDTAPVCENDLMDMIVVTVWDIEDVRN